MAYSPDEWEWGYGLWSIWVATGKRFLPSQLIHELTNGYGRALDLILDMEGLYGKTKAKWDLEHKENN